MNLSAKCEVRDIEVRVDCGARKSRSADPLSREKWASLTIGTHYLLESGGRIVVIIYCHGRSYKTMKDI